MSSQGPKNVPQVLLTWEDLWVTTSSLKDGNKAILKGLTGYARPVESLMMIVASIVPNFLMGLITGAGIQAIMILSGMFKNEFEGLKIHDEHMKGLIKGEDILRNTWQMDMDYSKWIDLAILLGMLVSYIQAIVCKGW
ncbi:hypothetical protein H5410_010640 [Solanum commersonii]|uniref:Uncharacterized protein n=1 Tax=Solanum commersonii TaxID=4109 RepID=A0A9J6ALB6_SOLCO|nr:hypothetical protein H5410_010640 [Solanum commersonii]